MQDLPSRRSFPFKTIVIFVFVLTVAILFGGGIYYATKSFTQQQPQAEKKGNSELAQLVEKVGALYDLPKAETPTLATVSDVTKLSGQEFFKRAQNGDKVLIYTKAKKAILYRPSTNKIIEVGPVNINNEPQADVTAKASESASASAKQNDKAKPKVTEEKVVKVSLLNGTKEKGVAARMEEQLETYKDVATEVVGLSNSEGDYDQTIVIDLTGKNSAAVKKLAAFAKGKVALLPKVESAPAGSDILIILGNDFAAQ